MSAPGAVNLAAALLFTVKPTDRALAGWYAADWADGELEALGLPSFPYCEEQLT